MLQLPWLSPAVIPCSKLQRSCIFLILLLEQILNLLNMPACFMHWVRALWFPVWLFSGNEQVYLIMWLLSVFCPVPRYPLKRVQDLHWNMLLWCNWQNSFFWLTVSVVSQRGVLSDEPWKWLCINYFHQFQNRIYLETKAVTLRKVLVHHKYHQQFHPVYKW